MSHSQTAAGASDPGAAPLAFPDGFLWGAATAAHQIEGNNVSSDWWERETTPGTEIAEPSGDACDSYNRWREDMDLLAASGLAAYRFSIEWARIEPAEGQFSRAQLLHYREMIQYALDHGITPSVTLHHFTVPAWFAHQGGFTSDRAVELFTRYVRHVLPILDGVTWVCTINEPNIAAMLHGERQDRDDEGLVSRGLPAPDPATRDGLLACHRAARDLLRAAGFQAGWCVAPQTVQALPGCERQAHDYGYPRDAWWLEQSAGDDWVGVQCYTRNIVGPDGPLPPADDVEKTKNGWEYYPPALEAGVRLAAEKAPGVPIFVTENGMATDDDARRVDYTCGALAGLHAAIADGVDVRGYFHWSLLDNYEWGSYEPTFGLVAVDHETFERHPKPSLAWLGSVSTANAVTAPTERGGVA